MDYEKAYTEALERARSGMQIDEVFPELKESEDERIRKEIEKDAKEWYKENYEGGNPQGRSVVIGAYIDGALAYLEKQKAKENYDRMAPIYENRDSFESALEKAWKFYIDSGSSTVDGCEDNVIELAFAKGFREGFLAEKQKERKPDIELIQKSWYIEGYHDAKFQQEPKWVIKTGEEGPKYELNPRYNNPIMDEQKPAECLKPERDCWYVCIKDFYAGGKKQSSNGDLVQAKGGMYMMGREDISEWFRKAYYDELKPAEWSEEDEYVIDKVLNWAEIVNPTSSLFEKLPKKQFIARLKSLRPQPHWKPSEEQMTILEKVVNFIKTKFTGATVKEQLTLESLFNDLKKL